MNKHTCRLVTGIDMRCILLLTMIFVSTLATMAQERAMVSRSLLHNTVRLQTQKPMGQTCVGTGFFYSFRDQKREGEIPVIVTCKHVIEGSVKCRLFLALGSTNSSVRTQNHFFVDLPYFEESWIRHPDPSVDLAVMPLAPIIRLLRSCGKEIDVVPLTPDLLPNEADMTECGVFQEVKFIGYPIGIWDEKNNLPIVRRGMTATDPSVDYNGKPEFLIDAAVYPGSSGSPVFVAYDGMGVFAGRLTSGPRVLLLGVLYGVHQFSAEGKINIVTIPTAFDAKTMSLIPANLGIVTKASRLQEFMSVFDKIAQMQEKMKNKGTPKKP